MKLAGALGLLLALALVASLGLPVSAQPQVPHYFWGNVTIGVVQAPEFTVVMAEVRGVQVSTTVDALGRYGWTPSFQVPADDLSTEEIEGGRNNDTINFYVDDVFATSHWPFTIGGNTPLDLNIPGVTYDLTMAVVGNGTVTPDSGTYPEGDMTITATADSGWDFVSWSTTDMGEIANSSALSTTLTLDRDKTVTANFVEEGVTYYTLDMEVVGSGTVTPEDGSYPAGDMPITATPAFGWEFDGWSTDDMAEIADSSAESTTLTLDKDKTVTANFTELPGMFLVEGVNIIAYTGATANLPGALTNLPIGVDGVVDGIWARGAWTAGGDWLFYNARSLFGDLTQLEAGRAYVIVVTQDYTWELP